MMKEKETSLATRPAQEIFQFNTFREALEASKFLANSTLVPKEFRGKPQDILICWQYGAEIGLKPMQSMQSVAVINGRPCLWGDGLLSVAMSHPDFVDCIETLDNGVATCVVKRRGRADTVATFSMQQAKSIGLDKGGVWRAYPERMLQMRARGFAVRDAFADALRGFKSREEVEDYQEPQKNGTTHETHKPQPLPKERSDSGSSSVKITPPHVIIGEIENADSVESLMEITLRYSLQEQPEQIRNDIRPIYMRRMNELREQKIMDQQFHDAVDGEFQGNDENFVDREPGIDDNIDEGLFD